ncbi:MAG: hypothetical protein ACJA0S_000279 [Rickettsiales bacterium]|jgi:hypothetical protein
MGFGDEKYEAKSNGNFAAKKYDKSHLKFLAGAPDCYFWQNLSIYII